MESHVGIGDYLIEQIMAGGVRHVFGVPGDYVLGFFRKLTDSPLKVVNTCDEQGAGYAADAYARLNGLGVVVITYGVGGLKVANTTAEAFAEEAPVLVISGAPGTQEKSKNPMLHHKVNQFDTQIKVFEQLTVATADLSDPESALQEIDRVLAAIRRYKRPGYIELPRNMVSARSPRPIQVATHEQPSDPGALAEAIQEAVARINAAQQPVILVGDEMHRFGLQQQALQFAERLNVPMAVTVSAKSAVPETHPLYMGVYAGALGDADVRRYVESSDCQILLGVLLTDMNLGIFSARLEQSRSIHVTSERINIGHHFYSDVKARDFLEGLVRGEVNRCSYADWPRLKLPGGFVPGPRSQKITVQRLFEHVNAFLDCNTVVLADVGDSLFGAIDLMTCNAAQFLSPAYYASLGFAVPASLAVQLSDPDLRPLVLVGDGAFQMTGMELSTAVRFGQNPIVVVLNNSGYATERPMMDGPFNDILPWHFSRLPELLGHGKGFVVETDGELHDALEAAREYTESFSILDVRLAPDDISPALQRMTKELAKRT